MACARAVQACMGGPQRIMVPNFGLKMPRLPKEYRTFGALALFTLLLLCLVLRSSTPAKHERCTGAHCELVDSPEAQQAMHSRHGCTGSEQPPNATPAPDRSPQAMRYCSQPPCNAAPSHQSLMLAYSSNFRHSRSCSPCQRLCTGGGITGPESRARRRQPVRAIAGGWALKMPQLLELA